MFLSFFPYVVSKVIVYRNKKKERNEREASQILAGKERENELFYALFILSSFTSFFFSEVYASTASFLFYFTEHLSSLLEIIRWVYIRVNLYPSSSIFHDRLPSANTCDRQHTLSTLFARLIVDTFFQNQHCLEGKSRNIVHVCDKGLTIYIYIYYIRKKVFSFIYTQCTSSFV